MTEEELSDAKYYLDVIEHRFAELLPSFDEKGEISRHISEQGSRMLDDIEVAKRNIGIHDIRFCNDRDLIKELKHFHEGAENFDRTQNAHKCKGANSTLIQTTERLEKLLNKKWNTSLAGLGAGSSEAKGGGVSDNDEEPVTAQAGAWMFIKSATLTKKLEWWCNDCNPPFKYTSGLSYKRHRAKKHKEVVTVDQVKTLCRLPHDPRTRAEARHSADQIVKHLRVCHKITKPGPDYFYRGWQSDDSGQTWAPVFLKQSDPDPVAPELKQSDPDPVANIDGANNIVEEQMEHINNIVEGPDNNGVAANIVDEADNDEAAANIVESDKDHVAEDNQLVVEEEQLGDIDGKDIVGDEVISNVEVEHRDNPDLSLSPEKEKNPSKETENENRPKEAQSENHQTGETAEDVDQETVKKQRDENEADFKLLVVEDEIWNSSPEAESQRIIREPLVLEEDSDCETTDSDEMIRSRINNKIKRYNERALEENEIDICDDPKNAAFIESFTEFVVKTTSSEKNNTSTVSLSTGLLFRHEDSFLRYETAKDPSFRLESLLEFVDETKFLEIKMPNDWIEETAGPDPNLTAVRSKEKFKAHARLRMYLKKELNRANFGSSVMEMMRRDKIKDHINSLTEEISSTRTWKKLSSQIEANRRLAKSAKQTLHPTSSMNMLDATKKYIESAEFRKRLSEAETIYQTTMSTGKITARPFLTYSNLTRHFCMLVDRNRNSAYSFTNAEFMARRSLWFPTGFNQSSFEGLPPGHNFYDAPSPKRNPDAYVITVNAANNPTLKLSKDCDIIIFPVVSEMMLKFREIKDLVFGDLDSDAPFFVGFRGKPLGPIGSGKGSILEEMGRICEIPKLTTNTLRSTLEPWVQSSHQMKTRSRDVGSHSSSTGEKFYDKEGIH